VSDPFQPCGDPGRRRFVAGLAGGGVLAGLGASRAFGRAADPALAYGLREPTASEFALDIGELPVNFTGGSATAVVVNGSLPAPILRWREGETVTLRVGNRLREMSSIHWHGILLPANMDGVPGFSFHGIGPGESYLYRFTLRQAGTYWYHSHSLFQEQRGVYGAIVVEPQRPDPHACPRDHVILLSDWTDRDPHQLFLLLKRHSDYFNYDKRTVGDFLRDAREQGLRAALRDRGDWGRMRMSPTDLADVNGHEYTYLMNGVTPAGNWTGLFSRGEKVRLRFINGSAMSYFDVRIPGLRMTVVAADGQDVHPVTVDEFRLPVAETLDVVVEPDDRPYTIFAQSLDRSGYARGTLAPRAGMQAEIPALDRRAILSMADMGHGGMDHSAHGATATPDPHAGHAMPAGGDHAGHAMSAVQGLQHPASETGSPAVDMQTMAPEPRLDDPGIGLRMQQLHELRDGYVHGHKVLTLADLRSRFEDPDGREPGREIQLHLTGHMERYVWGFDGLRFSDAEPLRLNYGERLRITLVNDTMMEHPIHLHGMWSDVEDGAGEFRLRKHTVTMPPGTRRSYRVSADALGRWAYHCHLLYHMEAGMFREVVVR
jgi:CopA family copper-resistance protein